MLKVRIKLNLAFILRFIIQSAIGNFQRRIKYGNTKIVFASTVSIPGCRKKPQLCGPRGIRNGQVNVIRLHIVLPSDFYDQPMPTNLLLGHRFVLLIGTAHHPGPIKVPWKPHCTEPVRPCLYKENGYIASSEIKSKQIEATFH